MIEAPSVVPVEFRSGTLLIGDVLDGMASLPAGSVHCCVTSPPYWALRDYLVSPTEWPAISYSPMTGLPSIELPAEVCCLGMEKTPEAFVGHLLHVFRGVWRVLRSNGVCFVNLGDSYASSSKDRSPEQAAANSTLSGGLQTQGGIPKQINKVAPGLKNKDLVGIPWRFALAMQADGWYLRSEIIWCLSGGAWVYARTQKGDMPVMVKDLVRLKPSTVRLWNGEKWTRVLGWGPTTDEAARVALTLRSGERIGCTGGHLWPTQRGNVRADELRIGDVIQTCQLPEPDRAKNPGWLTDDALWFLGLFMAEGSIRDSKPTLALHADELHWIDRLRGVVEHFGGSLSFSQYGNKVTVRMFGRGIVAAIETYIGGRVAKDKHLKVAAWSLPNAALRLIAEGYLAGDGHHDVKNDRFRLGFCRNYSLERDLRTLAARLGASIRLKPSVATYQGGTKPAFRGEWRWTRSGHHNEKQAGEVVRIDSSNARNCWDIAVEDEPHLFALASGVLTHNCKPSPMPESVRDRCTKAHEPIFQFAKSEDYFFDHVAIQEPASKGSRGSRFDRGKTAVQQPDSQSGERADFTMRNKRSVWRVSFEPYKGAHFAVYPTKLIEPMILAGTSERGVCSACGAQHVRWIEKKRIATRPGNETKVGRASAREDSRHNGSVVGNRDPQRHTTSVETVGWAPACKCDAGIAPAVVLDPFMGSGTTAAVAAQHNRRWVGCELNPANEALVRGRLSGLSRKLSFC